MLSSFRILRSTKTTLYVDPRVHGLPEQKPSNGQVAPLQHLVEAPNISDKTLIKTHKIRAEKNI